MARNKIANLISEFLADAGNSKRAGEEVGVTEPAQTGSRYDENTSTVKEQVGENSVDSTGPQHSSNATSTSGSLEPNQTDTLKASPAGENVPAVSQTLTDPGTSHPARVDNEKISAAQMVDTGNQLMAKIAAHLSAPKSEGGAPAGVKGAGVPDKAKDAPAAAKQAAAAPANQTAGQAGDTVTVSRAELEQLRKQAAAGQAALGYSVGSAIADTVNATKQASAPASDDLLMTKAAEVASMAGADALDLIHFLKQANGMSPEEMAALEAALGDAGSAGDGAMGGGAPPMDPAAMGGGGDMSGMGGMAPADPAAMGGGGEVDPALIEVIMQELASAGLTPEQLAGGDAAVDEAGATELNSPTGSEDSSEGESAPPESKSEGEGESESEPKSEPKSEGEGEKEAQYRQLATKFAKLLVKSGAVKATRPAAKPVARPTRTATKSAAPKAAAKQPKARR